jgi:soluble lytic murein transglycosylase-like protein
MSFMDRINSIESRISQLDAQTGGSGRAAGGAGAYTTVSYNPGAPAGTPAAGATGAPTFQSIMGTMAAADKFKPSAAAAPSDLGTWNGGSKDFDGMITEASKKYGVDESLIKAVIKQESAFNPNATSSCGAKGLMQMMPATAGDMGVTNLTDPYQNIMGGTKYLKSLMTRFDGNLTKVIAGYNAGPGAVEQHGGLPPFPETQNYVARVMDNYRHYKGV